MSKKNFKKRRLSYNKVALLCLVVVLIFGGVFAFKNNNKTNNEDPNENKNIVSTFNEQNEKVETYTASILAAGDIMVHTPQLKAQYNASTKTYNFDNNFKYVKKYIEKADYSLANLETTLAGNDVYKYSSYPMFNSPDELADALKNAGFDLLSTINNHSYDKGAAGIDASRAHWAAMPDDVVTMGFYNLETYDDYAYQTVNGITFGYLSYTEHTNGLPTPSDATYGVVYLSDLDTIERQIAAMRPNCDVLVVSCHWGVEGSHDVVDSQRQMAQWLADRGVDLIIGTHPHVTQTAEWLTGAGGNTSFVAYSLGNFLNAQSSADNVIGAVLDLTFQKTTQLDGSSAVEMQDPKLHCVVTQYEDGWKNVRVYPYPAYTDEMGAAHGNFTLTREYIESVLYSSIDEQFITLD